MVNTPVFRKHDRNKVSSFRSYNSKMLTRYDTCFWLRLFQVARWDKAVIDNLQAQFRTARILDVGCATGRLLERLAAAGATNLAGTDLAPRILDVAAARLSRIGAAVDLQAADAEDGLPWDSGSFDVVTMTGVLHHFYRPLDALAEIHRVLRPRGVLIVMDPWFLPPVRQALNSALRIIPHDGDYRFYSPRAAARLVTSSRFEISRTHRVGLFSFLIRAAKVLASTAAESAEQLVDSTGRNELKAPTTSGTP